MHLSRGTPPGSRAAVGKRIVLVGAGGFGRGVYSWLRGSPAHLDKESVSEIVFIDDNESIQQSELPWISTLSGYHPEPQDELLCTLGNPKARKDIVARMIQLGATFHTFVDDRATIGDRVSVGNGSIICPGVTVSADTAIGSHVHINFNCSVGHDVKLESFSTLSPTANVMGEVSVGTSVFIGGSAAILPRLNIGADVLIGAGSVVLESVPEGFTAVGNPAKLLNH